MEDSEDVEDSIEEVLVVPEVQEVSTEEGSIHDSEVRTDESIFLFFILALFSMVTTLQLFQAHLGAEGTLVHVETLVRVETLAHVEVLVRVEVDLDQAGGILTGAHHPQE